MDNQVYLIGIGGIGMSALARYYKHNGWFVSGYDRTPSKLTAELEREGIEIYYSQDPKYIPPIIKERRETLVIYTPALSTDSQIIKWFVSNGYKLIKRSEALEQISKEKEVLAVAGTHGKTSTSTLLAHIIQESGEGCTAFLGGISNNYNSNFLVNTNNILVAEADEYDRSFLRLWPKIAVINSIDADHLDIYHNRESFEEAFSQFTSHISPDGALVVKKGLEERLVNRGEAKCYTFDYNGSADFYASDIVAQKYGLFDFTLNYPGGSIKNCTVGVAGEINLLNGIAAAAVALLHGTPPELVKRGLATFKGVKRRFETIIKSDRCSYIDDYAHHPRELEAAIRSIKGIFPNKKLTAIFQPHLYSRTKDFAMEFAQSLNMADDLILLDIYPARELPIEGVTSEIILQGVTLESKSLSSKEELFNQLDNRELEVIVTFGAGDIDRLVEPIAHYLKQRYNV